MSAGRAARRGQRKPNTSTQVNDTPRALSKGQMVLQEKQKMATTQQAARAGRGLRLPDRPHTVFRPRGAPCPRPPQACATGEELKCAQHKPLKQADPLQVRNPS